MKRWKITCTKFKDVREQLQKNEKTINSCKKILDGVCLSINEIVSKAPGSWEYTIAFKELRYEILDEIESMLSDSHSYAEWEDAVNTYLDILYDLCDKFSVWLEL